MCEPPLFAVADGMGGAQAGELASRIAAAALEERGAGLQGEAAVAAVVQDANDRIFRRALDDPDHRRDGNDGDRRPPGRGGRHDHDRARGRLAGLPRPWRPPGTAHRRPLARRRARPLRPVDTGGGGPAPAPLGDHAGARHRGGGGGRHAHRAGRARRPVPDLLRRADDHGRGTGDPRAWSPARTAISTRLPSRSLRPPTRPEARTTSPSCSSRSRRGTRDGRRRTRRGGWRRGSVPARPSRTQQPCRHRRARSVAPAAPAGGRLPALLLIVAALLLAALVLYFGVVR